MTARPEIDNYRREHNIVMVWTDDMPAVPRDIRRCGVSMASMDKGFTSPRTHYRFTTGLWEWSGNRNGRRYYGTLPWNVVEALEAFDVKGELPKFPFTFTLTNVRSRVVRKTNRSQESVERAKLVRQGKIAPDPDKRTISKPAFGRFAITG